jgi:hypothetical protein
VEGRCAKFYAAKYGRPSLTPGIYFRSLLLGYFEGIDSERGIAWQLADSLGLRRFVGIGAPFVWEGWNMGYDNSQITCKPEVVKVAISVSAKNSQFSWICGSGSGGPH